MSKNFIWTHKSVSISLNTLDNYENKINTEDFNTENIQHNICITKKLKNSSYSIDMPILEFPQIIYLQDTVKQLLLLDYKESSTLADSLDSEDYINNTYVYNTKLEDEIVGSHGISIERVDKEYKLEKNSPLSTKTFFNLAITFYDSDDLDCGTSTVIRNLSICELVEFSNVVSSFLNNIKSINAYGNTQLASPAF